MLKSVQGSAKAIILWSLLLEVWKQSLTGSLLAKSVDTGGLLLFRAANMIDEFEVDEGLRRDGVIGKLSLNYAPQILEAMLRTPYTSNRAKERLKELFEPHI